MGVQFQILLLLVMLLRIFAMWSSGISPVVIKEGTFAKISYQNLKSLASLLISRRKPPVHLVASNYNNSFFREISKNPLRIPRSSTNFHKCLKKLRKWYKSAELSSMVSCRACEQAAVARARFYVKWQQPDDRFPASKYWQYKVTLQKLSPLWKSCTW